MSLRLLMLLLIAFASMSCASLDVEREAAPARDVGGESGELGELRNFGGNHARIPNGYQSPILPTRSSLLIESESGEIWLSCSPSVDIANELWFAQFGFVPLRPTDDGQLIQLRRQQIPVTE